MRPRVLNLYAGVGGNRAWWPSDAEVTAVELDPGIAEAYATLWPQDTVVVGDAHRFLLDHLTDGWDLVWASPPCPSHSKLNRFGAGKGRYRYPDLDTLYGEIILLREFAPQGMAWLVENVIPYYEPLVAPTTVLGRHYGWSNRWVPPVAADATRPRISRERQSAYKARKRTLSPMEAAEAADFEEYFGLRLPACADGWGRTKRRQVMRNCVHPLIGRVVWDAVFTPGAAEQDTLFDMEP
ncbi:MAG: DNA cytosine methyltransferase [Propionibacteriaceae bacterium]|nr:DNA cytosine methyltransferase [Propionibacteriaceae bacterium]